MSLPRKKLPTGIQSFAKLRQAGCYYVDKTGYALRLLQGSGYYFLSRPRRFGKSLFLDTLKEIFEGNWALFSGELISGASYLPPVPVSIRCIRKICSMGKWLDEPGSLIHLFDRLVQVALVKPYGRR